MDSYCNESFSLLNGAGLELSDTLFLPSETDQNSNSSYIPFLHSNCTNNNDTSDYLHEPEYYSYTYRIIGTLFQGIIFLIGVVGNFLVVFVVARTKSMHSPTNCYLVSLALADIIALVASVPNEIIFYYLIGDRWVWGKWGCALFTFSQFLGINASSLSLTAFTVERYIAICHPLKSQTMCTVSRAKRIILSVWIFSFLYCSPWLFLTKLLPIPYKGHEDVKKCSFKLSREAYVYIFLVDLIAFYIFPLLLSMVLYGLIARVLFRTGKIKGKGGVMCHVESTRNNKGRAQVVKMLVMVVVIFAVLWLPYRGMVVYNSFAAMFEIDSFMDLWFLMLAKTCVYINSAINPILYNAMSVKFRRAFGRTLSCSQPNQDEFVSRWGGGYTRGNNTLYTSAPPTNISTANQRARRNKNNQSGAEAAQPIRDGGGVSSANQRARRNLSSQSGSSKPKDVLNKGGSTILSSIEIRVERSGEIDPCLVDDTEL